jgi:hypothetical protein
MMHNKFLGMIQMHLLCIFLLCSLFTSVFVFSMSISQIDRSLAVKINGPIMTKNIGDVSGSDVFKISIGLTNLSPISGIVEVCLASTYSNASKICNIIDASKEYLKDFPLQNCDSCIISAGTYVFPRDDIPINSNIQACVISLNSLQSNCDSISNSPINKVEDIILRIPS